MITPFIILGLLGLSATTGVGVALYRRRQARKKKEAASQAEDPGALSTDESPATDSSHSTKEIPEIPESADTPETASPSSVEEPAAGQPGPESTMEAPEPKSPGSSPVSPSSAAEERQSSEIIDNRALREWLKETRSPEAPKTPPPAKEPEPGEAPPTTPSKQDFLPPEEPSGDFWEQQDAGIDSELDFIAEPGGPSVGEPTKPREPAQSTPPAASPETKAGAPVAPRTEPTGPAGEPPYSEKMEEAPPAPSEAFEKTGPTPPSAMSSRADARGASRPDMAEPPPIAEPSGSAPPEAPPPVEEIPDQAEPAKDIPGESRQIDEQLAREMSRRQRDSERARQETAPASPRVEPLAPAGGGQAPGPLKKEAGEDDLDYQGLEPPKLPWEVDDIASRSSRISHLRRGLRNAENLVGELEVDAALQIYHRTQERIVAEGPRQKINDNIETLEKWKESVREEKKKVEERLAAPVIVPIFPDNAFEKFGEALSGLPQKIADGVEQFTSRFPPNFAPPPYPSSFPPPAEEDGSGEGGQAREDSRGAKDKSADWDELLGKKEKPPESAPPRYIPVPVPGFGSTGGLDGETLRELLRSEEDQAPPGYEPEIFDEEETAGAPVPDSEAFGEPGGMEGTTAPDEALAGEESVEGEPEPGEPPPGEAADTEGAEDDEKIELDDADFGLDDPRFKDLPDEDRRGGDDRRTGREMRGQGSGGRRDGEERRGEDLFALREERRQKKREAEEALRRKRAEEKKRKEALRKKLKPVKKALADQAAPPAPEKNILQADEAPEFPEDDSQEESPPGVMAATEIPTIPEEEPEEITRPREETPEDEAEAAAPSEPETPPPPPPQIMDIREKVTISSEPKQLLADEIPEIPESEKEWEGMAAKPGEIVPMEDPTTLPEGHDRQPDEEAETDEEKPDEALESPAVPPLDSLSATEAGEESEGEEREEEDEGPREKGPEQTIHGILELKPPEEEDTPFLTLTYDFSKIPHAFELSKDYHSMEYAYYKYKPMLVKAQEFTRRKMLTNALNYYRIIKSQNIPSEFRRMINRNIRDITEYLEKYLMARS